MSCGVGCRHGSNLALLWLWHRLAAIALIPPLAWEFPYAIGAALKKKKKGPEHTILYQSACHHPRNITVCPLILKKMTFYYCFIPSFFLFFPSFLPLSLPPPFFFFPSFFFSFFFFLFYICLFFNKIFKKSNILKLLWIFCHRECNME